MTGREALAFFVVDYDYGTGRAYVGILAESADQIRDQLKFVTVLEAAAVADLEVDLVARLKEQAVPISDASWDDIRRPPR